MLFNRHDQYIGRSLEEYGEFSEGEIDVFRAIVKPGDVAVEAGANVGAHTLALSHLVGRKGAVLAFEPQRIVFQTLCANLALNGASNVYAHPQALADRAGQIMVPPLDYASPNNFGGLALGRFDRGEPVPVVTLDSMNVSRCNLLKADVNGMEAAVLRGAAATIRRLRPFIYVACDRADRTKEVVDLLRSMNYRLYWHRTPLFHPANYFGNERNVFGQVVSNNMLAIHESVQTKIEGLPPVE